MKSVVGVVISLICPIGLTMADSYKPRNTQKPGEHPPGPAEAVRMITVPEGFQVRLFAGEPAVRQPVAMALDDRGRLFVGECYSYKEWENKGEDRIVIFEDTDNDGHHDSRKLFASGIDHLSGMTVGWGGVWVCSAPHLLFYPDADRDDIPDSEPIVVLDGWTTEAKHNFFNGLTWGPDGWLYGRHGITRPSLVGKPGTPEEGRIGFDCAIWRYHPVTEAFEVVCRGTTNPWGLDWNEKGDLFFTNNVNGHLWHAIPGAYYPRMGDRQAPFDRFVYDRIAMCADHLHHAGEHTDWTKTRDGLGVHDKLGGGHSHCGGMIYRGGKWPDRYRGKMFMCNTHGRRINVDRLDEEGVTYVGRHEPDFLHANNPWFRGVELIYGPDGDVYLSDWVDNGECHDNDGVHRTSGRIYKIIHGEPSPPMKENLWEMGEKELLALSDHPNHWYVRQSEWILRKKVQLGVISSRLDPDRASGMTFLEEGGWRSENPSPRQLRLAASALSAISVDSRWDFANELLGKCPPDTETTDLLIYYGIKDQAAGNPGASLALLETAGDRHYLFTKNLSRNLAENGVFGPLITMLARSDNEGVSDAVLGGLAAGVLKAERGGPPEGWNEVFEEYFDHPDFREQALAIHLVFSPEDSRDRLETMLRQEVSTGQPEVALRLFEKHPIEELGPLVRGLLDHPELSDLAVAGLGRVKGRWVGQALCEAYPNLSPGARAMAVNALSGNRRFARDLLGALEAGRIPTHAVTAYHARQIQTFRDEELSAWLERAWGRAGGTSGEKREQIRFWENQLLPDVLARADLSNGRTRFQQLCHACHQFKGEGGNLGPELDGANRRDLYYLLENIIDPSATLPADFRMTVIRGKDGSVVSGMVKRETEYTITLGNPGGEITLDLESVAKRELLPQSIMPEGLLEALKPDDVRDLIGYLQR